MAPIKRVPPPPSTHRPLRIVVRLSNGKSLRITRTPQGLIQIRMAFGGVTYPGPEFNESDLQDVIAGLERMSLKMGEDPE